jgi:penicillin-binding protein 2
MQLGVKSITEEARKVGFGVKTGVDLPYEMSGFIPSVEWYDNKYGKGKWGRGIAANIAVGQGEIITTPLQLLYFISGVANKGILCKPRIVDKIINSEGKTVFLSSYHFSRLPWSSKTIEIIREGMLGVVNSPNGTGRLAMLSTIKVAGKTGTAQNPTGETHAWFAAFAPYEKPKICLVLCVEHGGMGGSVAAPIAGKILERFFQQEGLVWTSGKE